MGTYFQGAGNMDWESLKRGGIVREIKPDKNLVKSLMKSASQKLYTQNLISLNENTSGSKISLSYDSLRELLEALAVSKGYKIYNHEGYAEFLKEVMLDSASAEEFDKFRKVRNSVNYYGKEVSESEAEVILGEIISLIEAIKKKYKELQK